MTDRRTDGRQAWQQLDR